MNVRYVRGLLCGSVVAESEVTKRAREALQGWKFGGTVYVDDGGDPILAQPYIPLVMSSWDGSMSYYSHEGKKYDVETLGEIIEVEQEQQDEVSGMGTGC